MASNTPNLNLLKKNPTTDGSDYFDIETVLNDNWDIIDTEYKTQQDNINNLEAQNILTQDTLSQHKSIFAAGTGKDSLGVEQDHSAKVLGQSNVKIEGSTAVNLVKNGDFSNGSTGWTWTPTSGGVVSDNEAKITPTIQYDMFYTYVKFIANHVYYFTADIYGDGYTELLMSDNVNFTQLAAHSPVLRYEKIAIYHKPLVVNNSNNSLGFRSVATSSWIQIKAKNFMFIDLTALFGAGNEPTKEQCDYMYNHYIDGLQGVGSNKIVSTGKNICGSRWLAERIVAVVANSNYCYIGNIDGRDCLVLTGNAYTSGKVVFDKFKPNTQYTISYDSRLNNANNAIYITFKYTDGSFNENFYDISTVWGSYSMVSELGKTIESISLQWSTIGTIFYDINTLQIEEGAVATPYEPYQSSELITTMPTGMQLHRLPNGAYDSVEEVNAIRTLFKKIKEYTLVASDISELRTEAVNIDAVLIKKPTDYAGYNNTTIGTIAMMLQGFVAGGYADSLNNIGNLYNSTTTHVGVIIPKGTYATLAAAQTALAGTKVVYELATPLIYANGINGFYQEGNLEVYEDGTIYQESSIDSKEYNNAKLGITYNLSDKALIMANSEEITAISKQIIGRLKNADLCVESGNLSNAEGAGTQATGAGASATGAGSIASGLYSRAEGYITKAIGNSSHAEGASNWANGDYSHCGGLGNAANGYAQTVIGRYNVPNATDLFQIGNGTSDANRSNAMVLDNVGNLILGGGITPNDTLGVLTSTKGTIVGGYIKRGREVVFSVKLTLTASIAINDVIVSGFPAIVSDYSAFRGCAPFLGTYFDAIIYSENGLITGGAYNNGQILYISGSYISVS
jgi:hypothetical protein